jgi:Ca2+-binding RTX toxin-like protein
MTNKTSKQPNYIINPKAKIAGKTQTQLADGWWKYANSIPQEDNPALERTGDFSGANQSGDVYYLSGVFNDPSGVDINRKIVVPEGKILFVPIIGAATLGNNIVEPPPFSDTSESNLKDMKKQNDNIEVLNLTIDGKPVLNLSQAPNYRQQTVDPNGFSFNTPENGTFTDTPYNNAFLSKSYADGYYVGINALPVGKHTISFQAKTPKVSGDYGENIQNITYTIDVKPFNKDINGDDKNNTLKGNWKNDNIDAFGGDDTVYGYAGDDIIDGGAGNDKLYGGDGNDIVYGGAGNDLLDGGCGDDVLAGGLGYDKIYGGEGNDRLYGGSGNDEIYGGDGHDTIYGGDGNDKIEGGHGNDVIDAVAYSKLVLPYRYAPDFSAKFINSGQEQIDTLKSGAGRDTFVLGLGSDKKSGVTGSAYYVGGGDKDYALIQDFKLGYSGDKIQLYSKDIKPSDYVLGAVANGLPNGVGIYTNDTAHDLIGIVQGDNVSLATLNLTNSSQFNLVG